MKRPSPLLAIATFCMATFCVATSAIAHPSVSIVLAPNGDVFYSDLQQVWRIPKSGPKQVAVPRVHAHELYGDAAGALFGEDSQYLGGDRYRHRIWRRGANGRITDVIPWTDGFFREYGLTRDASGGMYWVTCTPAGACGIRVRDASGRTRDLAAPGRFNTRINSIAAAPAGDVYVIDGPLIRRVTRRGTIETVARIASGQTGHGLMGLTVDRRGNLYVAAHWAATIYRITPTGEVKAVIRTKAPWLPSGIAFAPNGDTWVLEWSKSAARVRRISPNGQSTIY